MKKCLQQTQRYLSHCVNQTSPTQIFPYDKNRQVKVHSRIAKSNLKAKFVRNRTVEDSPKTPNTESIADTSPFYTTDLEK